MRSIIWLGVISIFGLAMFWVLPKVFTKRGPHDLWEAMNNLRQINFSLLEFEHDYHRFPDDSTRAFVKEDTATPLTLGDGSSNQYFRQLIAHGVKSEKPFWAKTATTFKKPDDVSSSDSTALSPGECGFAYIPGLSSTSDPATPIVMTPLLKGRTTFDPGPYRGKAVILFPDSVKVLPIDRSGRVMVGGMDIFDPRQPFWKGKAPDIKWQE